MLAVATLVLLAFLLGLLLGLEFRPQTRFKSFSDAESFDRWQRKARARTAHKEET